MNQKAREGGCRCGRVRLIALGAPVLTMACHCTGCQRMTGGPYSLSALYPSAAFEVTLGEPVLGGLNAGTPHYFCGSCMSWLFTRLEGIERFVNVRSTMLDAAADLAPFIETYTSEMLPWAATPAVHRFERFPEMERLGPLIAEFAARSNAPTSAS